VATRAAESGEQDLFHSQLDHDQIIDMSHAPVKLARTIEGVFWKFGAG
jgi:hypothetical protein